MSPVRLSGVHLTSESAAFHTSTPPLNTYKQPHTTMASLGRQEFPPVFPRQPASNNSFSIKSILNLSEDSEDEFSQARNHERNRNRPMFAFPIVPQAIRPAAFNIEGDVPMYNTTQWFSAASHFPPWLLGTRFMRYLPGVTPYLRRRRNVRKRKQRPLFSQRQVQAMEQEFSRHRYVSEETRAQLASTLNLTETQVKTWFQNRRTKWRKEARDEMETALMDSKRRWKNDAEKQQSLASSSTTDQCEEFIDLDNYKLNVAKKSN